MSSPPEREKRLQQPKQAVKTTIVGGQPPGNERPLPPIPVGIEELLSMAAVNAEFAAALHEDRQGAISASGVTLTATESAILASIDEATLRQMIANVEGAVPDQNRRAFLARSAAALLALATGGVAAVATGCTESSPPVTGIRPDRPPPKPSPEPASEPLAPSRPEPGEATTKGIRPDRPRPSEVPVSDGARPDRPEPDPEPGEGEAFESTLEPGPPPPTRGISPDRPPPPPATRGISPDRPGSESKE